LDYIISETTAQKLLEKHHVFEDEVIECFQTRSKKPLIDNREEHRTHPPTEWFIAETYAGRRLKVVYIQLSSTKCVIRTTYPPSDLEEEMYEQNT
jgi:hypothetical protein